MYLDNDYLEEKMNEVLSFQKIVQSTDIEEEPEYLSGLNNLIHTGCS